MKKDKPIIIKGEWYPETEYYFRAECKCGHIFQNYEVNHYDGEKFQKTLNCPKCKKRIQVKAEGI